MRVTRPQRGSHATRPAFTLTELLIVIAIIAVLLAIGTVAYFRSVRSSQETVAQETLRALAVAVQAYYDEHREYPAMRFTDIVNDTDWPDLSTTALPNADQSVAALVYQLQYLSTAGDALKSLPSSAFVPLNFSRPDSLGGPARQLYTIRDPWGKPIQYLRPRGSDKLSAAELNNRVLLVSMGKDGSPGDEDTVDDTWDDSGEYYPNPDILKQGKADDVLVLVGSTR